MANTSSRMLRLLCLLQTHRYWSGADLAQRLDVSPRTLRRDVDRLRELGYPVEAQRGVEGGYQLAAGASLPPLVLDDDEAVALALGLLTASQSSVANMAESALQALTKVIQVMPKRLRRRVDAVRAMTEPVGPPLDASMVAPDLLTTSAQACRDGERLEFDYTAADGTPTQRRSEPYRIVSVGRRWYLVAYDLDRHDWRSFRLDRMTGARSSGVRVAPRRLPAPDAASFVQAGLNQATTMRRVEVVVAAPADVVRERIGRWADIEVLDERRTGVRIHTDSWAWAALALAAVQSDFQVHGPDEFIEYLRGWNATLQRALPVP